MRKAILAVSLWAILTAASANPPFNTDDPGVFPVHTGEAYLFTAGGRSADGWGLDAAPCAEVNYSLVPNTFFHLVVPLAYSNPAQGGSAYGMGDVATFPLAELPTGSVRRGLGGEVFHSTAQEVDGSKSTAFDVGGGYAIGGDWQVLFSAGRNFTDVTDNRFSYYLSLYRAF